MALYVPEKKPLVLNSRSASRSCVSLRAVHASPSSITIFPNRIPRAYMFGIVITYSVSGSGCLLARGVYMRIVYVPPSSGRPINVMRFSPSMVVETELPRNLDLGRSSPTMQSLFAGET